MTPTQAPGTHPERLLAALDRHLSMIIDAGELGAAHDTFRDRGFLEAGFLAPAGVKAGVAAEAETLISAHGVRRDVTFAETGYTARHMRNVRRRDIQLHGTVVPTLYSSAVLAGVLSSIAGCEVVRCPYEPEQYVITELAGHGDTHRWHWDDYSLALVWIIACPPVSDGGFVQYVPNTTWNKADPQLHRQFIEHPIYSAELRAGDLYLMRTNTVLHRVYPIQAGRRLILNMAYAAPGDLARRITHDTMDTLWGETE